MTVLVELDENGRKIYRGFLSSKETEKADLLLGFLQDEIPSLAKKLEKEYGSGALYKYYLGKRLGELLDEYNVTEKERLYFWEEIKNFAPDKIRKRQDGGKSKNRKFYEQCYRLSKIDKAAVEKLSWKQWQDLLDRTRNREDERIFQWIAKRDEKIKQKEWNTFEKCLNQFLKNKDTSVFDDEELFDIYEMIMIIGVCWTECFDSFVANNPKSMKIKSKSKWEKKYYDSCFKARKANGRNLNVEDCKIIFNSVMNIQH